MILERLLRDELQERIPLRATRLVIHSTANPGATDETHFKWLDADRRHGWAHYYLDWDSISQLVPEGLIAPAQGPTANQDSISIELCEPASNIPAAEQRRLFDAVWARGAWLAADILLRYGWGIDRLQNHADITQQNPTETDHTDPLPLLRRFGKTWAQFVYAAAKLVDEGRQQYPAAAPWQESLIDQMVAAGQLNQRRHPLQPVVWWELAAMLQRYQAK